MVGWRFCFHPCLFGCEQDNSTGCGRIRTKLGGQVGCVTRKNVFDFDFDEDPHPDLDQIKKFECTSDSSPFRDGAKNVARHDFRKQKCVDGL